MNLTDLWHCANLLTWLAADAAVLLSTWPMLGRRWGLGYVVLRRLVFQQLYSWLRKT